MNSGVTLAPNCAFTLGEEKWKRGGRGSYNLYEGKDILRGLF